jgi:methionyl-tRNA formyltransferase
MNGDHRLKILEAEVVDGTGKAGEILDKKLTIACGQGALTLKKVQPQDRGAMDGGAFMNGARLSVGDKLS